MRGSRKSPRRGPSKVNCPSTSPIFLLTSLASLHHSRYSRPCSSGFPASSFPAMQLVCSSCIAKLLHWTVQHTVVSTDKPLYVVFIGLTHAYYPARFIQTSELRSHSFPSQGGGHPNNDAGSGGLADRLGRTGGPFKPSFGLSGVNNIAPLVARPGSCPVAVDWARCIVVPSAHPSCAGDCWVAHPLAFFWRRVGDHKESHC